jgi:hypothetical protein
VVNLFPNKADLPTNMPEIAARMKDLQFANKSLEDTELLGRFNEVAALMDALEALGEDNPLKNDDAYKAVKAQGYVRVPRIISIMPPEIPEQYADADFSPEAIEKRAKAGESQTRKALRDF